MKLVLALMATLALTACGTTIPKLTRSDLVYFPAQKYQLANYDECGEVQRRLSKFPKEYNNNNNKYYYLDIKTQKAYSINDKFSICMSSMTNTLEIISFFELADENDKIKTSKQSKENFVRARVDKLGI